jgi:hypothetical protein
MESPLRLLTFIVINMLMENINASKKEDMRFNYRKGNHEKNKIFEN